MPLTLLNCTTTCPDDSTHPSSLNTTHTSMTHPYPLDNFFSQHSLPSTTVINHHHPSSYITHYFSYTPFHVTDDSIQFHFFQLFPLTVVLHCSFRLFHSIHGSVQFYLCDFHCYVSILSLTQLDLEKFTPCDLLFFVVLHCPFRLLHPIHVSVQFYFSIFTTQFPLLSLTQHGFEKFHPSYLSFFRSNFLTLPLVRINSIHSTQGTLLFHLLGCPCARRCLRGCPNYCFNLGFTHLL